MISAANRPYIDASVPVLREHGLTITRTFYTKLFAAHPELSDTFNMGNQANGAQQQSLASAVFAYAANIGNPGALGPVVNRIVHKHASVGIRAEHYPLVGACLLESIADVLGDAASAPLLAAWDEAYNSLAALFIDAERKLYGDTAAAGATSAMEVVEVLEQSADVVSIRLRPADGGAPPAFQPGQYVSVYVTFADGSRQIRQYSLSDAADGQTLRISVKREAAGEETPAGAVSNWLHEQAKVGGVLQVSHPYGDFTPDAESEEPIVLLSAGVGITPLIATLARIAQVNPQRRVLFAHAARDAAHHAHQSDLAALKQRMPNLAVALFYETVKGESGVQAGRMTLDALPSWPRSETEVWMCGPLGFMQAQWQALVAAGVPMARLHREVFGPEALDHLLN